MLSLVRNLRQKIAKTKSSFLGKIAETISLRGKVDEELMEEIEDILLRSDTGVEMATYIIDELRDRIRVDRITDVALVQEALQDVMKGILLKDLPEETHFFTELKDKGI